MAMGGGGCVPQSSPASREPGPGPLPRTGSRGLKALDRPLHLQSLRLPIYKMEVGTPALHRDWSPGPVSHLVKTWALGFHHPRPRLRVLGRLEFFRLPSLKGARCPLATHWLGEFRGRVGGAGPEPDLRRSRIHTVG